MAGNSSSAADPGVPGKGLRSEKSAKRLELIAGLRARGIGNHVSLPQLVVCGDQSAGKSSVLEGLTGVPFPQQEGLCTTFATEIILQHREGKTVVRSSIIASESRSEKEKINLSQYHDEQPVWKLPEIIDDVTCLLGIRKSGTSGPGPAFVEDVLHIEVHGPHGTHLSIVDLPGLISVPNEEQTSDDKDTVHRLADRYMQDRRTIILAVVQAGNDIANQPIIEKSKTFDPEGERTVGIITKPDLINAGAESRIARLASNKDTTKLKLGFFLIKNPSPRERSENSTVEKRHDNEKKYFKSSPWSEQTLIPERTGTPALSTFLQTLLEEHIERELPRVREEIKAHLKSTEAKLDEMGIERSTPGQMRTYLTSISMEFQKLLASAENGMYNDNEAAYFFGPEHQRRRLRAITQNLNSEYAEMMRKYGQKRHLSGPATEVKDTKRLESIVGESGRLAVTEEGMEKWVKSVYEQTRGKEVTGTHNFTLLSELYHQQIPPWRSISSHHIEETFAVIERLVDDVLSHAVLDQQVRRALEILIGQELDSNLQAAWKEFDSLWNDENRHPVTYNRAFTNKVNESRQAGKDGTLKAAIEQTVKEKWGKEILVASKAVVEELSDRLLRRMNIDMIDQACTEAMNGLDAYYEVSRNTFVDNVCKQVIERHLLCKLTSLFTPKLIAEMDDEELTKIAGERFQLTEKRRELNRLKAELKASLKELRAFRHS